MYCSDCGAKNAKSASFCSQCGKSLNREVKEEVNKDVKYYVNNLVKWLFYY